MSALDLDAIEARAFSLTDDYVHDDILALVAALQERDNTITRVREVLDADGFEYTNFIPRLRAALDPQEAL